MTQNLDYAASTPIPTAEIVKEDNPTDTGLVWDDGLKVVDKFYDEASPNNAVAATGSYDAHYLTGNYYQYSAATVACPAISNNWQLPTGNQASTINGSFNKLVNDVSQTQIITAPYYFPPAGHAGPNTGSMFGVGEGGYYWSSTLNGDSGTYGLRFSSGGVNPSDSSSQYVGLSVRCYVNGN